MGVGGKGAARGGEGVVPWRGEGRVSKTDKISRPLPEFQGQMQGQNLALTVLHVPSSLDAGGLQVAPGHVDQAQGTSLPRKRNPLGTHRRHMPRVLGSSRRVCVFL